MAPVIILLFLLPFILKFLAGKLTSGKKPNLPPGPKSLPFIGNIRLVFKPKQPLHISLYELSKKYGELMYLHIGCRPALVVSSAKMAEKVLRTYDINFCSRAEFLGQQVLTYQGSDLAFAPYGPFWRELRKIAVVHLFSLNRVQSYRPIRESEVRGLTKMIDHCAEAGKPINLSEACFVYASGLICRMAFGKKYDAEGVGKSRYEKLLYDAQTLFISFFFSDFMPKLAFLDKVFGLTGPLEDNYRAFDAFNEQVIKEHLDPNRVKPEQEDVLDVLLSIYKDRTFKLQFTMEHVKAVLTNIFFAATDTSSSTLIWAMTYLMMKPKVMEKVQTEIRNQVGKRGFVTEEDIKQMPYFINVVKETMRVQPAGPLLVPREVIEDCKFEGYDLKAKTTVYVNAYAVQRDPEVWDDPEDFRPERYEGKDIDLKGNDYELIPFGAGRRICPGMNMGLASVEGALANMLYKFNWHMPAGMKREDLSVEARPGIAIYKKIPLSLVPSKYI